MSQWEIAFIVQASTQASTFHVKSKWAQTGNDSLTMHDIIRKELIDQPMKYSVTEIGYIGMLSKQKYRGELYCISL